METTSEKLINFLKYVNKEDLEGLSGAIDKVMNGIDPEKTEIKAKVAWVLGNSEDPGNYLSLDFKIG